jgi:flavin reductase (DIM6/NTAB) family NADH-FMN oxidoreductase RutF
MSENITQIPISPSDPARESVNPDVLRQVMRHWSTGVSIVTAQHQGMRHGMTVSSFTSVSLQPPIVLVALDQSTRTHALVSAAGYFGVSVLSNEQKAISECFSGQDCEDEDRFAGLETLSLVSGVPFITGSLAFLDCRVVAQMVSGSNTLFIAEVLAAQPGEKKPPLIYFDRKYRQLQD